MTALRSVLKLSGLHWFDLARATAAGAVTLIAALSLTVLSGWLITRAWQMPPILDLGVAITAVRGLGISRAVFRYLDRLVSHRIALNATTQLRAQVFNAVVADDSGCTAELGRGEGLARLGADIERVTGFIVRAVVPASVAVVVSILAVIAAALFHPLAALALAVGFVVTGVLNPWLIAGAHRSASAVQAEDTFTGQLDGLLLHRAEFRAGGILTERIKSANAASRRHTAALIAAERPFALATVLESAGQTLAVLTILAIGLLFYPDDPTWLGMLALLPLAAFESHGPLATAAITYADAKNAAERLVDMCRPADSEPGSCVPESLDIHATMLTCAHGTREWEFEAPVGTRMLIRGPSGIGKTTLLLTVAGLLPPHSGSLTIGGIPIQDIDPQWLRARIHAHPENEWVFATTIRDNVLVAGFSSDERCWAALQFVGLSEFVSGLGGLDSVLINGAESLSSGQRRRLLLARALASPAQVLLLDEPTAHLDSTELLDQLLTASHPLLDGRTFIVVSHDETPDTN